MGVSVYIPTPFRRATANEPRIDVDAVDVKQLLDALEGRYDGLRGLMRDEAGEVHHHVNVYVNGEEIGSLQGRRRGSRTATRSRSSRRSREARDLSGSPSGAA
jgi:hypothetical protein